MSTCMGGGKMHAIERFCPQCLPQIRSFVDPQHRAVLREMRALAEAMSKEQGIPAFLTQKACDAIIVEELVERWESHEFVDSPLVCSRCGTRVSHSELHCAAVEAKLQGMLLQAKILEAQAALGIDALKASLSGELRRRLLAVKQ